MKNVSLEERIARSQRVISSYPSWVKKNSKFQGGGVVRDCLDMSEADKKKVRDIMKLCELNF